MEYCGCSVAKRGQPRDHALEMRRQAVAAFRDGFLSPIEPDNAAPKSLVNPSGKAYVFAASFSVNRAAAEPITFQRRNAASS